MRHKVFDPIGWYCQSNVHEVKRLITKKFSGLWLVPIEALYVAVN